MIIIYSASEIRKMLSKCEMINRYDDRFFIDKAHENIKFSTDRFEVEFRGQTFEVMLMYKGNSRTKGRIGGIMFNRDIRYFIVDLYHISPEVLSDAIALYSDLFTDYNFLALSTKIKEEGEFKNHREKREKDNAEEVIKL